MIKLVFIITGLDTGGAEMMVLKLLERLSSQFAPSVISLTNIGSIGQRIQALGIPVTALGMRRGIPDPVSFWRLVALLHQSQPDIVHTWMYHADLLGGLAAKFARVPTIVWNIRHSDLSRERTKFATRLTVNLCAKLSWVIPDKIQCCSAVSKDIHTSSGYVAGKFVITPNGFDLEKFQPDYQARLAIRNELDIPSRSPLVGLIARFNPQKNHAGFLAAADQIHRSCPDVHFLLAGTNVDRNNPRLMETISQFGLADVVHLLGVRDDIPRLMAALDVLVSSSSCGEAFPNVLGEAMACGVSCVVTDVGDSAYIVGDTGMVVPPNDMASLAKSIEIMLTLPADDHQKLGRKARQRIQENFEIKHVVDLYESLYENLSIL